MKFPSFKTGKPHQERTAKWIRSRLSDRCFFKDNDQSGVLLADAVGMGKTWEALAGTALILNKIGFVKTKGDVLVICPPNLITKWEDELSTGSPFRERLDQWIHIRNTPTAKRIGETLARVVPVRRSSHVQTRKKYGKFHPESGTYIVSHSLLCRSGRGLSSLRKQKWDVIIVDEAHHVSARKALDMVQTDCEYKLLLTATPFQLEPREWDRLTHLLVKRARVLKSSEIKTYIEAVADRFKDSGNLGPTGIEKRDAEKVLKRVVARTIPKKTSRNYSIILPDGNRNEIPGRIDELDDDAVQRLLATVEKDNRNNSNRVNFERAYLKNRYSVATSPPTFVATKIRRFLASGTHESTSPRLIALQEWAKRVWVDDIEAALKDGLPRKTIVFTSWKGDIKIGEASELKKRLSASFLESLRDVKRKHFKKWEKWRSVGADNIRNIANKIKIPQNIWYTKWEKQAQEMPTIFENLSANELCAVLAGANKNYSRFLLQKIKKQLDSIVETWAEYFEIDDKWSFEGRGAQRRLNDAISGLRRWGNLHALENVERYTGDENRINRDNTAAGFREPTQPWVLVASNVGAEGIDLHTYTRRIVHYDLEWNPARMEQREGRGDRVGRILKEPLEISYCIVPRTYDERMFHQLVARDRWHGVLLGKAGAALAKDEGENQVQLESAKFIRKVRT